MRTKALVCAAVFAAGAFASWAQSNVYSLNVVGYVNVTNTIQQILVANPLNAKPNNAISNVLANVPPGTLINYWNGGGFSQNATDPFQPTAVWTDPTQVLAPGTGFYLFCDISGGPVTTTFVGEVAQGALSVPLPAGYSLLGSPVPQAGYIADLGLAGTPGDLTLQWNGGFVQVASDPFSPTMSWSSSDPAAVYDAVKGPYIKVAEGFFYFNGASAGAWTRNFTVQ